MTKDLTEGKPFKLILGFSVPVLMGYLFQQFYNIVDTVIVGKFLGVEALAAVGATGSVNFLIIGFCLGLCSGFAIPVAQKFGAKDYVTMRRFVASSAVLSVLFAAVITAVTVMFSRPLLELMRTPSDIIEYSCEYIVIIFLGIPVVFLYNLLAGIIRAVGDSRTPVVFLVISSFLNIGLDLFFIPVLGMGIGGAALATVLSEGVSGVACLIFMVKKFEILRLSRNDWKLNPRHFAVLTGMGLPMGLQYSITAIGSVILQSSVNQLGSKAVASVAAAMKIHMFFCAPFDALGTAMATYGGQNTGAGKLERLKIGVRDSLALCFAYSAIAFTVMYFAGRTLSLLFLDRSQTEILMQAHRYLIVNSLFYPSLAIVNVVRFMIQGMGFSRLAIVSGVIEMIARTLAGILLVPAFGFTAACFASPSAWVLADLFLLPAFFCCYRLLYQKRTPEKCSQLFEKETIH